jgi:hypothetical protein
MSIERQIGNVYFDKEDGVYRLDVEYFDRGSSVKLVEVGVEFPGTEDETFASVQARAYEVASKTLRGILDTSF